MMKNARTVNETIHRSQRGRAAKAVLSVTLSLAMALGGVPAPALAEALAEAGVVQQGATEQNADVKQAAEQGAGAEQDTNQAAADEGAADADVAAQAEQGQSSQDAADAQGDAAAAATREPAADQPAQATPADGSAQAAAQAAAAGAAVTAAAAAPSATESDKTDSAKADGASADATKTDASKADEKKTDAAKTDEKKADAEKADAAKDAEKKADAEKADADKKLPAFEQSQVVDDVRVTVQADEGTFPEGSTLRVEKVSAEVEQKVADAVEQKRDTSRQVAASYTFDIKVLDREGHEVQPADQGHVHVSFATEEVTENLLTTEVYHVKDASDPKAEALSVSEKGDTATAETKGFSTYKLIFSQGKIDYNMEDASESLESLMNAVQLGNTKLYNVTSSDPARLAVEGPAGAPKESDASEWKITAAQDITDENPVELTVRLFNRPDYRIYVTATGTTSAHEIKLLSVDGHELPRVNGVYQISISQVYEVFVTGFTDAEQDALTFKYKRNGGTDTDLYRFTADLLHQGSDQGTEVTTTLAGGVGYRYLANRRGETANKPTSLDTNLTIEVYANSGDNTPLVRLEGVDIHAGTVSLQKDLNDAARNMRPIVLHKGDTITSDDLKERLAQAGIAHPKCNYTEVVPQLDGRKTLAKATNATGAVIADTYVASNSGHETITIDVTKVNCFYHSGHASPDSQTGTLDVDVYVLDNPGAEYDVNQGLVVSGLSEYSTYEIYRVLNPGETPEQLELVKQFDASELTFRNLDKNKQYTVISREAAVPESSEAAPVKVTAPVTLTVAAEENYEYRVTNNTGGDINSNKEWKQGEHGAVAFSGTGINAGTKYRVYKRPTDTPTTAESYTAPTTGGNYISGLDGSKEYMLLNLDGSVASNNVSDWTQPSTDANSRIYFTGLTKNQQYKLVSREYKTTYTTETTATVETAGRYAMEGADPDREYRLAYNNETVVNWTTPTSDGYLLFDSLYGGREYQLISRIKAVPASDTVGTTDVTTGGSIPTHTSPNPEIIDVTKTTVTVRAESGLEYSINGGQSYERATSRVFDDLSSGTYKVVEIVNGINFVSDKDSEPREVSKDEGGRTITITKNNQDAPDEAPSVTTTPSSVTVNNVVEGQQYLLLPKGQALKESDWSDKTLTKAAEDNEPITFSGLESNTEYVVYTRKPGTTALNPSSAKSTEVRTDQFVELTDANKPTIAIKRGEADVTDNKPKVGDVLTVSTTATPVEYKWYYVDESGNTTGDPIGTGNTYTVQSADNGKRIVAVATQNVDESGKTLTNPKTATSNPTDAVTLKDNTTAPATGDIAVGTSTDTTANPATDTVTVKPTKGGYEYMVTTSKNAPSDDEWTNAATSTASTYYKETAAGTNSDGHSFTGLATGVQYYVHVRQAATDDTNASPSSVVPAPPAAPNPASSAVDVNCLTETITPKDGFEIYDDKNGSWVKAPIHPFEPGKTYQVRKAEDPANGIPASSPADYKAPERPGAPTQPTVTAVDAVPGSTTVSISVSPVNNAATYTVKDGSGNPVLILTPDPSKLGTFNVTKPDGSAADPATVTAAGDPASMTVGGLEPNKTYKVEAIIAATVDTPASVPATSDSVTTKKGTLDESTINGNSEYQVKANNDPALVYDGNEHDLVKAPTKVPEGYTMQYGIKGENDAITWSTDLPKGTNAGDYEVYVKYAGDANHDDLVLKDPIAVTIASKNINDSTMAVSFAGTSFTYNGQAQGPTVTVKDGTTDLTKDTDYELKESPTATDAGDYTVKVVGKGNYTGEKSQGYNITKRVLADGDTLTVEFSTAKFTFNGNDQRPTDAMATVKVNNDVVPVGNYKLTFPEKSVDAGEYKVQVTLEKNFSGSGEGTYKIVAKSIEDADVTKTFAGTQFIYSGAEQGPVVSVAYGTIALHAGTDYTVEGQKATYASDDPYTVKVKGQGNYTGEVTSTYKINRYKTSDTDKVTVSFPDGKDAFPYNGEVQKPAEEGISVVLETSEGQKTLTKGTDYTLDYSNPNSKDVGAYYVTITLTENFEGSHQVTQKGYAISSHTLKTIAGEGTEFTYDGEAHGPSNIVVTGSDDKTLVNDTDYTLSNTTETNAGTYKVIATGKGNYEGTVELEYTIKKAGQENLGDNDKPKVTTGTEGSKASVTVNPSVVGQEYVVVPKGTTGEALENAWTSAKDGNGGALVFGDLEPGTEYEVLTRKKGDDNHDPSNSVSTSITTKPSAPSPASDAVNVDYLGELIEVKPGYEIRAVSPEGTVPSDWSTGTIEKDGKKYIPLTPGATYDVRVAEKTEGGKTIPASDPANPQYVAPTRPAAPAQPTVTAPDKANSEDAGKLTIENPAAVIYTVEDGKGNVVKTYVPKDGGGYTVKNASGQDTGTAQIQDGKLVIDGLQPNTEYTVTAQTPATETTLASEKTAPVTKSTPQERETKPSAPNVTAQNTSVIINPADSGTVYTIKSGDNTVLTLTPDPEHPGTFKVTDKDGQPANPASVSKDANGKLTVDGLQPNTEYTVTATKQGTGDKADSEPSEPTPIKTGKATQEEPESAPQAKAGTDSQTGNPNVVVDPSDKNQEYVVLPVKRGTDGTVVPYTEGELQNAWQNATPGDENNGPVTITKDGNGADLKPGVEYQVLTRKKGDTNTDPSAPKSATVVTPPNPTDAVTADGENQTLTPKAGYEILKDPNADPTDPNNWVKAPATVKPFTPGATYPVRKAADPDKNIPASEPASYKAPDKQTAPTAPTVTPVEATPGSETVAINIAPAENDVVYSVKDADGKTVLTLTPDPDSPGTFKVTDKDGKPADPATVTKTGEGENASATVGGLEPNKPYTVDAQRPASGEKPASDIVSSSSVTTAKAKLDPSKLTDDNKPTAKSGLTYNGTEQPLVDAPKSAPAGYTMQYATSSDGPWYENIPTRKDAHGENESTPVYVKYVGDEDHDDLTLDDPINVSVAKKAITKDDVDLASTEFIYSGEVQGPVVTVKVDGRTLVAGTDYDIAGQTATDKGTHTVTVEGAGNYTGKVEKTYTIKPYKTSDSDAVTVAFGSGDDSFTYDGADHRPDPKNVVVKLNGKELKQGEDYDLVYPPAGQSVETGGYEVKVVLKGNYEGETAKDYAIVPADAANFVVEAKPSEFVYSGKPQGPVVTVKSGNTVLIEGTDYDLSGATAIDKGDYKVTIVAKGNYSGTTSADYKIGAYKPGANDKVDITFPDGNKDTFAYDGADHRPAADGIKVTLNGKELVPGEDYDLEYSASEGQSVNAGSYDVKVVLKGNYASDGAAPAKGYKIEPKNLTEKDVTFNPLKFDYNGEPQGPNVTVKDGNQVLKENEGYTAVGRLATDANTYQVTVKGTGNYTGTVVETYIINKAKGSATTLSDDQKPKPADPTPVYDGNTHTLVTAPTGNAPDGYTKMQYATSPEGPWSDELPIGVPAGDYPVYTKYVGDKNHDDLIVNGAENPLPAKIAKGQQADPAAPSSDSVSATDTTVTVNPTVAGQEYVVVPKGKTPTDDDWAKGKKSEAGEALTFDGLDPATEYEVITRKPGDDNHDPSKPASVGTATKPSTPKAEDAAEVDYKNETVKAKDGYEIFDPNANGGKGGWTNEVKPFEPGATYPVRKKADPDKGIPASDPVDVKVKPRPAAPAPVDGNAVTRKETAITIDPTVPGQEYVLVPKGKTPTEDDWKGCKTSENGEAITFDNLTPGTEYEIVTRVKATDDAPHSDASSTPAKTKAPIELGDKNKVNPKDGLAYNGQSQPLVSAPEELPEGCTGVQYSTDGGKTWQDGVPTGRDAGETDVMVKYVGDGDHDDLVTGPIKASMGPRKVADPDARTSDGVAALTNDDGQPVDRDGNALAKGSNGSYYVANADGTPDESRPAEPAPAVMVVGTAPGADGNVIGNLGISPDERYQIPTPVYDARVHGPVVYDNAVKDADGQPVPLTEGTDYDVEYYDVADIDPVTGLPKPGAKPLDKDPDADRSAFDAGDKVAVITFKGNHTGTLAAPIKIEKRTFHVVTQSAEKDYDGTALKAPDPFVWVEGGTTTPDGDEPVPDGAGLVGSQRVEITVTGEQTEAGESENVYRINYRSQASSSASPLATMAEAAADFAGGLLSPATAYADGSNGLAEGEAPTAKEGNYNEVADYGTLKVNGAATPAPKTPAPTPKAATPSTTSTTRRSSLPKTSDDTPSLLPLAVVAAIGAVLLAVGCSRRREGSRHEGKK